MKNFTREDLKTNDFVVRRDGVIGVVIKDSDTIVFDNGMWEEVRCYKDDLSIGCRNNDLDIIKVLRGAKCFLDVKDYIKNPYFSNPIGIVYDRERDTVEEMTLEEVYKALGKNVKIVKE